VTVESTSHFSYEKVAWIPVLSLYLSLWEKVAHVLDRVAPSPSATATSGAILTFVSDIAGFVVSCNYTA
jgi:hypothetical protein